MKSLLLPILAATASAHYTFPALIPPSGGATTNWQYVRKTTNYQSNGPVTDVTSNQIRCYELSPGTASQTYTVNAGDTVGFTVGTTISHPGPLMFYMAKVPDGKTASTWDGDGSVWFKIFEQGATFSGGAMSWASSGKSSVSVPLPKSLPSGDYLFRVEHIGLHSASSVGGAQFYISCAQLTVKNGGNGSPSPLVAFPGAYSATDPAIKINIYYPVPTSYTPPGPAVWKG